MIDAIEKLAAMFHPEAAAEICDEVRRVTNAETPWIAFVHALEALGHREVAELISG